MGEDAPIFCHSGWMFILSSIKRNMCHVFHTRIHTVLVLMLNVVLACNAKDLQVIFTQPWHQRNGAFKGMAHTILKKTYRLGHLGIQRFFFPLILRFGHY